MITSLQVHYNNKSSFLARGSESSRLRMQATSRSSHGYFGVRKRRTSRGNLALTQSTRNNSADERRVASINSALLVHQKSLLRNKRVLLAYLHARQSRLRQMRWESGPVLPPQSASNLSEPVSDLNSCCTTHYSLHSNRRKNFFGNIIN